MTEQMKLTAFQHDLLALLRDEHRGSGKAIKIAEVIDLYPQYRLTDRAVKRAVECLRKAGHYNVGSSRFAGLMWIETVADYDLCFGPYEKQYRTMAIMMRGARKRCLQPLLAANQGKFDFPEAA